MTMSYAVRSGGAGAPLSAPTALWVIPVSEYAGVGRHVLDVARHGIPGWRLVYLCPPGELANRLTAAGAAVLTAAVDPGSGIARAAHETRQVVQSLRPRIVHSHLAFADLCLTLAIPGMPVAVVTTEHGIAGDDLVYHGTAWRSRVRALAHTGRLRRADALIAVSASTAEVVRRKWHPGAGVRIEVIPNGIDPVTHSRARHPGLHIVSLARLAPEKGLDHLVRAFAVLAAGEPSARLTLAGTGPLASEMTSLVSRLGLAERVRLPGFVPADEVLATGDVLAQLSRWENCSYSLLDAQTHGLGVVATAVGGNPELLPARCLVPATDHSAVAQRLREQGLDPGVRPTLPVSWPTIDDMCARIADLYREVTVR